MTELTVESEWDADNDDDDGIGFQNFNEPSGKPVEEETAEAKSQQPLSSGTEASADMKNECAPDNTRETHADDNLPLRQKSIRFAEVEEATTEHEQLGISVLQTEERTVENAPIEESPETNSELSPGS